MKIKNCNLSKAQSLIEYSVLIIIIALSLLATQGYVKRALQGRFRQSLDNVGDQYDYWSTFSDMYIYSEGSSVAETSLVGSPSAGWLRRQETVTSTEGRFGNETVTSY